MKINKKIKVDTKKKISAAIEQAKSSLKTLEGIEQEAVSMALNLLKLAENRTEQANKKILEKLTKIGVASQDEVAELQDRIEQLEARIKKLEASHGEGAPHSHDDSEE